MRKLLRSAKYAFWVINGYVGSQIHSSLPGKATVLIASFNPIRMKDLDSQIRNILKCTFIEKIIISNHNPEIRIEEKVAVRGGRLLFMDQDRRRAGGYRWRIAERLLTDYLIVIDDDIFLFPHQLKTLFEALIRDPAIPHGLSGMLKLEDGGYQYREHENISVDYLCEVYAVTKLHVKRYFELERLLAEEGEIHPDAVEELGDYILISQTAERDPMIHAVGRIFRSETFKTPGIAYHKDGQFENIFADVSQAVEKIRKLRAHIETPSA